MKILIIEDENGLSIYSDTYASNVLDIQPNLIPELKLQLLTTACDFATEHSMYPIHGPACVENSDREYLWKGLFLEYLRIVDYLKLKESPIDLFQERYPNCPYLKTDLEAIVAKERI